MLTVTYDEATLDQSNRWYKMFLDNREDLNNEPDTLAHQQQTKTLMTTDIILNLSEQSTIE